MSHTFRFGWLIVLSAVAGCPAPLDPDFQPPGGEVLFRDDFDGAALADDWTVDSPDGGFLDLSGRAGFLRIEPPASDADSPRTTYAAALVEVEGDFVLTAALEFDPGADRHIAGLVIQSDDGRRAAFGLLSASGSRGSFRGILPVVDEPKTLDLDRTVLAYEESAVVLRVERNRDVFEIAYSRDGATFTRMGTVTANFSDAVRVGIGSATSEDCTHDCGTVVPADFDWFEIAAVEP